MRGSANYEKPAGAGFTIVRADEMPSPRIKKWFGKSSWTTIVAFIKDALDHVKDNNPSA